MHAHKHTPQQTTCDIALMHVNANTHHAILQMVSHKRIHYSETTGTHHETQFFTLRFYDVPLECIVFELTDETLLLISVTLVFICTNSKFLQNRYLTDHMNIVWDFQRCGKCRFISINVPSCFPVSRWCTRHWATDLLRMRRRRAIHLLVPTSEIPHIDCVRFPATRRHATGCQGSRFRGNRM